MHEAYGDFLGNAFCLPGKEPGACWWLAQPPWNAVCETLWGWVVARPCHAVHGRVLRESQAFSCFHFPPDMFTTTQRVFSRPWPPSHVIWAALLVPCLCSRSAPFILGSVPSMGPRDEPGVAQHGAQVGHAPQPGWWRREAEVSQGVRGLSPAARRSPGDSLCRAAPDGSWSQGRLQTMGGEQETPHGKQDLAPPPPPATAPWPLSFPCSGEPFPQPSATGLRRGMGMGMPPPGRAGA